MKRELTPDLVAKRLAVLRELYEPETATESRTRLRAEARSPDALVGAVERRLRELRALDKLVHELGGVAKKRLK